jgi:hypothetical protein
MFNQKYCEELIDDFDGEQTESIKSEQTTTDEDEDEDSSNNGSDKGMNHDPLSGPVFLSLIFPPSSGRHGFDVSTLHYRAELLWRSCSFHGFGGGRR